MDLSTIHKILLSLAAILPFARYFFDLRFASRSQLKEEYLFARDFMGEVGSNPETHNVVKEKAYQLITGNLRLTAREMENLLNAQLPLAFFRYFPKAKKLIDMECVHACSTLQFTKKLACKKSRVRRKLLCAGLYMIFVLLALLTLPVAGLVRFSEAETLFTWFISTVLLSIPAWHYLSEAILISRLETIILTDAAQS